VNNTALVALFFALMITEALGTGTFLVVYLRSSAWRDTATGRHLAAYSGALFGLYVVSIVSVFIHDVLMSAIVLGFHAVFDAVIWQRVWLVWQAQHSDEGN
jgi:hypothetical protein